MRAHARDREAAARIGAFQIIAAAAPFRVGHDCLPADLVERNVLRRMAGGAGNRQRREHAGRIARRPLQHLHAAHRSARHREQRFDAEMIEQHGLRAHHVADGDDGKFQAPRLAGRRVNRGRAGGAHAGAHHVRADHEIALGVDRLAGTDHGFPPARFLGDRMQAGHVLVAGERVAHQHGIGALGIERAVGLVGDLEGCELDAGIELERLVGPEAHHKRLMRMVRFARSVRRFTRAAQIGLDHVA